LTDLHPVPEQGAYKYKLKESYIIIFLYQIYRFPEFIPEPWHVEDKGYKQKVIQGVSIRQMATS